MTHEKSLSLHQQDGGMTLQAFAALHGLTSKAMRHYIRRGRVVGARQDARSKKWTIYPPAKLLDKDGDSLTPARGKLPPPAGVACAPAAGFSTGSAGGVDVGTSPHGLSADGLPPVRETREGSSLAPPAKPVLAGVESTAAKWRYNAFEEREQREGCALSRATPEHCALTLEAKRIRQTLHEAAAKMHREGIHYLRLESREFSQLYAALDHERSRIRKLVGKGLVDVGNLRASDSVWQKLQAMCQHGRLL